MIYMPCMFSRDPTICRIYGEQGKRFITSCSLHDKISYVKQCYAQSCDPPINFSDVIFKLMLKNHNHNQSECIILSNTCTINDYKLYSIESKNNNCKNTFSDAVLLTFNIKIEHKKSQMINAGKHHSHNNDYCSATDSSSTYVCIV